MTKISPLADLYAKAKAEFDAAEARLKALRGQILELGQEQVTGVNFTVTVGLSERSSLDRKAVELLLTEEQVAACTKTTLVESLRVKASIATAA